MLKINQIYFSKENCCILIDENKVEKYETLTSNQEEADTKVVLHCLDALRTPDATVILRSPSVDTDIMVLVVTLIRENLQSCSLIIGKTVKIGIVPHFHKQCKTRFRDHMVSLKIISLYIYKDLRLKT